MALNSPRPAPVLLLAQRRQALVAQTDANSPQGGGSVSDAVTLQGHPASYFAAAGHDHAGVYAPSQMGTFDVANEPTPGVLWNRKIIVVTEAGQPTLVKTCVTNSAGAYEWIVIAQSS